MIKDQNELNNLKLLAAQRIIHKQSKVYSCINLWLCVNIVVIFSIARIGFTIIHIDTSTLIDSIFVLYCAFIPYVGYWFLNKGKKLQNKAVVIQENFDCNVLGLLRSEFIKFSDINGFEIEESYKSYLKEYGSTDDLESWYPSIFSQLPSDLACLQSQRINCEYDHSLRKKYKNRLVRYIIELSLLVLLTSFYVDYKFSSTILTFFIPLSPLVFWFIKTISEFDKHLNHTDSIHDYIDKLWEEEFRNAKRSLDYKLRCIQDQILISRREKYQLPEKFYLNKRTKNENILQSIAQDAVNDYSSFIKSQS
jgi:hypothetical protein